MAEATTTKESQKFELPRDLADWSDRPTLLRWIQEEVETLNWQNPELKEFLQANPAYRPKTLLCLLSYAYARGIYEADEVARLAERDPALRPLGPGLSFTGRDVSRFRRENRGLIGWCLVQAFRRAVKTHYEMGEALFPPGLKRLLVRAGTERLDVARTMIRGTEEA